MKNKKNELFGPLLKYSSLGIEMGLCVAIGITIGYFLDKRFGTSPYLTIIFLFFGIAAAFKTIIVLIKKVGQDDQRNDDNRY